MMYTDPTSATKNEVTNPSFATKNSEHSSLRPAHGKTIGFHLVDTILLSLPFDQKMCPEGPALALNWQVGNSFRMVIAPKLQQIGRPASFLFEYIIDKEEVGGNSG